MNKVVVSRKCYVSTQVDTENRADREQLRGLYGKLIRFPQALAFSMYPHPASHKPRERKTESEFIRGMTWREMSRLIAYSIQREQKTMAHSFEPTTRKILWAKCFCYSELVWWDGKIVLHRKRGDHVGSKGETLTWIGIDTNKSRHWTVQHLRVPSFHSHYYYSRVDVNKWNL